MKKRTLTILLALTLLFSAGAKTTFAKEGKGIGIILNGEQVELRESPKIRNNRTMVPIREVAEATGKNVHWFPEGRHALVYDKDTKINIPLGEKYAYVNFTKHTLDAPSFAANGRSFVPIRFIAESFGTVVNWDQKNRNVYIDDTTMYKDMKDIVHSYVECPKVIGEVLLTGKHYAKKENMEFCSECLNGNHKDIANEIANNLEINHKVTKDEKTGRSKYIFNIKNNGTGYITNGYFNYKVGASEIGNPFFNFFEEALTPGEKSNPQATILSEQHDIQNHYYSGAWVTYFTDGHNKYSLWLDNKGKVQSFDHFYYEEETVFK